MSNGFHPKRRVTDRRGGRSGRPPAGFNGEPASKYPQLSTRVPRTTLESLRALSIRERRPIWRIVVDAVEIYTRGETKPSQLR